MTIEKRASGSYRVRQSYKGKVYSVTFDHKPTQKEINIAFAEKMSVNENDLCAPGSVESYAIKLINKKKSDGLSESTIKGYCSIKNNTPAWFLSSDISKVTCDDIRNLLSEYNNNHSAKSTRLLYSFYKCVFDEYRPYLSIKVDLPKIEKKAEYEPSTKDIKAILEYAKDSRYYTVLKLASIGLRRGEACAITSKDLSDDNILTIDKVMIVDMNNEQVIKQSTKTVASTRRILIPDDIACLIREHGVAFDGNMHTINEYLHKCQDALGIKRFRLHVMRHFAAAYLLKNGFTTIQIEDYMGWEHGSNTMQKVYAYNLDPEDSQKEIANIFLNL